MPSHINKKFKSESGNYDTGTMELLNIDAENAELLKMKSNKCDDSILVSTKSSENNTVVSSCKIENSEKVQMQFSDSKSINFSSKKSFETTVVEYNRKLENGNMNGNCKNIHIESKSVIFPEKSFQNGSMELKCNTENSTLTCENSDYISLKHLNNATIDRKNTESYKIKLKNSDFKNMYAVLEDLNKIFKNSTHSDTEDFELPDMQTKDSILLHKKNPKTVSTNSKNSENSKIKLENFDTEKNKFVLFEITKRKSEESEILSEKYSKLSNKSLKDSECLHMEYAELSEEEFTVEQENKLFEDFINKEYLTDTELENNVYSLMESENSIRNKECDLSGVELSSEELAKQIEIIDAVCAKSNMKAESSNNSNMKAESSNDSNMKAGFSNSNMKAGSSNYSNMKAGSSNYSNMKAGSSNYSNMKAGSSNHSNTKGGNSYHSNMKEKSFEPSNIEAGSSDLKAISLNHSDIKTENYEFKMMRPEMTLNGNSDLWQEGNIVTPSKYPEIIKDGPVDAAYFFAREFFSFITFIHDYGEDRFWPGFLRYTVITFDLGTKLIEYMNHLKKTMPEWEEDSYKSSIPKDYNRLFKGTEDATADLFLDARYAWETGLESGQSVIEIHDTLLTELYQYCLKITLVGYYCRCRGNITAPLVVVERMYRVVQILFLRGFLPGIDQWFGLHQWSGNFDNYA